MRTIGSLLLLLALAAPAAPAADLEAEAAAARKIAGEFTAALKGELTRAVREGGPAAAVGVCREQAPQIAARLAAEHGRQVGRTSLRVRNPANAPDAWEESVLLSFEARRTAGQDPAGMEQVELLTWDGRRTARYMQAIPTGELCLLCHGDHLAPEVVRRLQELYPQDRATGFAPGEIRGAFTISRAL